MYRLHGLLPRDVDACSWRDLFLLDLGYLARCGDQRRRAAEAALLIAGAVWADQQLTVDDLLYPGGREARLLDEMRKRRAAGQGMGATMDPKTFSRLKAAAESISVGE